MVKKSEILSDPGRPKPAPAEYGGQWVAWDKERKVIVAHGDDGAKVRAAAEAAGHADAILQKVPSIDAIFVGGA
jgi:hypothetical protein